MQKPSWAYCSWIWSTVHSLLTPDPCTSEIRFPMKLQSFLITSKFFWLWRGISALSQLAFQTVALQDTIRLLLFSPFSHSGGSSFHPSSTLSTQGCKSVHLSSNYHLTSRASIASKITALPFFGLEIHKRSEFCRFFTYTFALICQLKWGGGEKKWDMEKIFNKLILNSDYLQIPKCIFDEQDKLWSIFCGFSISYAGQQHCMVTACTGIYILRRITGARPTAKWSISFCWEPDFVQRCHLLLQVFTKSAWAWAGSLGSLIWFHREPGDYSVRFSCFISLD